MRVLLLGATGRTGKLVLEEARTKNHTVRCIVRKLPTHKFSDIEYFVGNPDNPEILSYALQGCDAIISVLNISRNSDFPWAKLRTPPTFLSDVMNQLIPLSHKNKIGRIVICSAWGVAETKQHIPGWFNWFIDNSNIGVAYRDHVRQEELLKNSDLNWTIVRPTGLTNSQRPQKIIASFDNHPKPRLTISRMSVAKYMVDALTNVDLIRKAPVISAH